MNKQPLRLGPLALLLAVVAIAMTTMAILTFSTSRADYALARKFANTVKIRYQLEEEGYRFVQDTIESGNSDGETMIEKDGYSLTVGIASEGSRVRINEWKMSKQWDYDDTIDDLWQGE